MFSGEDSVTFTTPKPLDEVVSALEEALQELGGVTVTKKGGINIEPKSKYTTTFADTVIEGAITQNKRAATQYTVRLSYKVSPTVACWIVAVLGTTMACFGFLVLLVPYNMKKQVQKDILKALGGIEDALS